MSRAKLTFSHIWPNTSFAPKATEYCLAAKLRDVPTGDQLHCSNNSRLRDKLTPASVFRSHRSRIHLGDVDLHRVASGSLD